MLIFFKEKLYLLLAFFLSYVKTAPVILAFHRVKKNEKSEIDARIGVIEQRNFKKAINFLKKIGYRFVTLDELRLEKIQNKLQKVAVLTFDDGYKDLYTNVYPYLKNNNIPFTLFLTTSTVDSTELLWLHKLYLAMDKLTIEECETIINSFQHEAKTTFKVLPNDIIMYPDKDIVDKITELLCSNANIGKDEELSIVEKLYLTSIEIYEMLNHGLTVELHSHMHRPSSIMNSKEIEEDLQNSYHFIQSSFHYKPRFWCLPFGIKNIDTLKVAKENELDGVISGPTAAINKNTDMFNLPRIEFDNNMYSFYKKLSKGYIKSILNMN
jgi:peptidoglycan/xylan/chitin deacetylase (PgdA/CDA1 family)